jgi:hypothetical protein
VDISSGVPIPQTGTFPKQKHAHTAGIEPTIYGLISATLPLHYSCLGDKHEKKLKIKKNRKV